MLFENVLSKRKDFRTVLQCSALHRTLYNNFNVDFVAKGSSRVDLIYSWQYKQSK